MLFFAAVVAASPWMLGRELLGHVSTTTSKPMAEQVSQVTALRWAPSAGKFFVHAEEGQTWLAFDHKLRLIATYPDGFAPVLPPTPLQCRMEGDGEWLKISGPSGRELSWSPDSELLNLSAAPWESTGMVQWGPGWATVEFRCTQSMGSWLEWQEPAGQRHLAMIEVDAFDPLIQRAFLRSLSAGSLIRLRHKPLGYAYPSREWTDWIDLQVPKVDPTGPRPTSSLQKVPSALPRAESPR